MIAAAVVTLSVPCGRNGVKFLVLKFANAMTMKNSRIASFRPTITKFAAALSRAPRTSSNVMASTMNTAGRLNTPPASGDFAIASGSVTPKAASEERVEVAAPADGDRRDRYAVLEDEVPADDPGDDLAERRVRVGVRTARHRDRRGQLRIGQGGERARHGGEDEGQDDAAGPAMPTPSPITTKMPVPMIAPTPIAVSCMPLTARFSSCPDSCVSFRSEETSRIAKMPGRPDGVGFCWPVVGSISTTSGGRRQCMRMEGTPDARRAP